MCGSIMRRIYLRHCLMVLTPMHESSNNTYNEYQNAGSNDSDISTLNLWAEN